MKNLRKQQKFLNGLKCSASSFERKAFWSKSNAEKNKRID